MRTETEFPDEHVKETAPLGVIGLGDVKLDRDMGFDVDGLQNSWQRRGNSRSNVLDGGSEGRVGAGIGGREIEERVCIHVHGYEGSRREQWKEERSIGMELISGEQPGSGCDGERGLGSNRAS
jgi:hypothetical protein